VRSVLATLTAVSAGAIGFAVTQYLGTVWQAWPIFLAIAAFVYFASLTAVIVDNRYWQLALSIFWGSAFGLLLPWRTGIELLTMTLILIVTSLIAYSAYRSSAGSYATLHIFSVVHTYAAVLTTGLVIALMALYGSAVARGSALLPQGVLAQMANQAARFIPTFIPSVTPASTSTVSVRDLALASAKSQLEQDPRYRDLEPAQQAKILEEAATQAAAAFTKQLGVNGTPATSIGAVAQTAVSNILERFHQRYGWYFTIAWLLGAFFLARSAAVFLTLIASALVWMTITASVALGLVRIETVPSIHERITL
jgi:hypothetical protein